MRDRILVELTRVTWGKLTPEERALFDEWAAQATGVDLFLLMTYVRGDQHRISRKRKISSSQTLQAVKDSDPAQDD